MGLVPPVPFIALFDNCYDSVAQDLTKVSSPTEPKPRTPLKKIVDDMASVRRSMMKQLAESQSDGLILYAAKPGKPIGDFADPLDDESPLPIGSLARRLELATRQTHADKITLRELRKALHDKRGSTYGAMTARFDVDSPEPYSLGSTTPKILDVAISWAPKPVTAAGQVENRVGTFSLPDR